MSAQPKHGDSFADRWLAEALRLWQQSARKTDALTPAQLEAAAIVARTHSADPESRLLQWARSLAAHTSLPQAQQSWSQRGRVILLLLILVAFIGGLSAALGVMGSGGTPVNVLWALGTLLGVNLLMLLFWLLSLSMTPGTLSPGRLWFWLNARFYGRESVMLAQAFNSLNQRAGLTRWWLACITHSIWSAAQIGSLVGLLLVLSLRSYAFVWETTILPTPVFTAVVQALGWLPSLLGFSLPDADTIRSAGQAGADALQQTDIERRIWAGWLCGAVLVYGLMPRLILSGFSLWRLLSGQRALRLDVHSADWSSINQQLSPSSEVAGITDPAPAISDGDHARRQRIAAGSAAPLVIAFELDEQMLWPVLPTGVQRVAAGSREQRQSIIAQLDQATPVAILLVCDSAQTVDRGSLAWLGEASGRVLHVAVWLAGSGPQSRRQLWRDHLQTLGISPAQVFDDEHAAFAWLEDFV